MRISIDEIDIYNWIDYGIELDAVYLLIVIHHNEYRPFYIFREQDVLSQINKSFILFGKKSLFYIIDLMGELDVQYLVRLANNFEERIEN